MKKDQNIDLEKIGARIREARKAVNLTQEKAAEFSFISGQTWSLIETGRCGVRMSTYLQIAKVLGKTLDDIFCDDATSMRLYKAFSQEGILEGCSVSETAIIGEAMLALKEILKRNRTS